jgi:phage terminase large subunit-like protein
LEVREYISDVLEGKRICGDLELSAVKRWKQFEKNPDIYYDAEGVQRIITIFRMLRHTSGEYYGKPFQLLPWQIFVLSWIFGWKYKRNNYRVTRKAYVEVSKKNGKSEFAGALGVIGAFFDGEMGAECYSAANKYDQATICWNAGKVMATQFMQESKKFASICKVYDSITTRGLKNLQGESSFKPIAADSKTLDGVRPHFAIIDEYHEAKDDSILRNLASGMVNRTQPLLFIITTAGFNINGPCHQYRKVVNDIVSGKKDDISTFGLIFAANKEDDWHKEETWQKANPSIGTTPSWEGLRTEYTKAINEGQSAEINFKTKNLNIWVRQSKTWITDKIWMRGNKSVSESELIGSECYAAVDLSTKWDLTCFGLLFPPTPDRDSFIFKAKYYCPEEGAQFRAKKDGVPYLDWAKDGNLNLTKGNVTDFNAVRTDINESMDNYSVQKIYYDPWQSTQFASELYAEGVPMREFRQTVVSYNEPIRELEALIEKGQIWHGGDPVLRWMAGNITIKTNHTGLVMFDKSKSQEKIDGMVVLAMCYAAYMDSKKGQTPFNADEVISFI